MSNDTVLVQTQSLGGKALDWAAAKMLGYAMREPIRATDEDVKKLSVPFTLYEVNYQQTEQGVNKRVWVEPITATRFGINTAVGATKESIGFTDSSGRQALGSADCYYLDPEEAQLEVTGAMVGHAEGYKPSTDQNQGGQLIDDYKIGTSFATDGEWEAWAYDGPMLTGETRLIAATRSCVACELGAQIEIPIELLPFCEQPQEHSAKESTTAERV